ncbi:low molecular weight phosphotyrosine protein phosphatase [Oscillochloris trichoides DG-6]|uniref:protein-tyrosine-phosphatase n=1 Tax=Oscillochloris trichoides DG-6 TaxID=765420 RepID=E1IFU4_9CHLR|nr:low molecular weight phosphotyrosine protein phosphatase [Oscillochloris trichoides]EFO79985.1 low molecular weight phosphotyrosine protein phosphatase [Oscillochloris trichoides DG-6]
MTTSTEPPLILIVGAADTGRAPITAALLRRMLANHNLSWRVASAGVVGHDNEPAQPEARDAMTIFGIELGEHHARSLTPELAAEAHLLIATDSGVARVLRSRHPTATTFSLGELAGRQRDIPDPFRMQVGAWLNYTHEIEQLLQAGFERLVAQIAGEAAALPQDLPAPLATPPAAAPPPHREPVGRSLRLIDLFSEMPDVVDWDGARRQMHALLDQVTPTTPEDMARPYAAIIQAMLAMTTQRPTSAQVARLRSALEILNGAVSGSELADLSIGLASYAA